MPVVYSLTELTGRRRNENRRMVVMTVEIKRRTFLVSLLAVLASVPVAGIIAIFAGVWAIVVPAIAVGVALWLWDSRQRKGLKLLNYQRILDQRRARNGVLYAAGQVIPKATVVMHQRQFIDALNVGRDTDLAVGASNLSDSRPRRRPSRRTAKARYA